jgi:hypothetical protein
MVECGGGQSQVIARLLGCEQAAASGQHRAQVIRQSLVDPEQIVLHRLLIVGSGEVRGTPVFSVPRMNVLVGEQAGVQLARGFVHKPSLVDAAVVGLMVLQTEVRDVIA